MPTLDNDLSKLWEIVGRQNRKWRPTPVFLPGKLHGQTSLMGYNPCGRRVRHDWVTEHGNFNLVIYFFIYLVIYLFQKPIREAILLENHHNFLLQQCLDGTWCSSLALASCSVSALTTTHPEPSTHPRPPPPPLSHLPGWLHPLADAAWTTARTRRMPSMGFSWIRDQGSNPFLLHL